MKNETPELNKIHYGDVLDILKTWPDRFIQTCITSPPYWGLRNYRVNGQLGLEKTPEEYIAKMVEIFREVRRVLRDDGTLWLNMGDSYAGSWGNYGPTSFGGQRDKHTERFTRGAYDNHKDWWPPTSNKLNGIKPKDLIGMPWRLAFALQAAGWWLRSDIIWAKKNAIPESVKDRPTKAHEYLFLLAKSERYYYDYKAVREPCQSSPSGIKKMREGKAKLGGKTIGHEDKLCKASARTKVGTLRSVGKPDGRNKRTVWFVSARGFSGSHYATFPPELITPCILAGCPGRGIVLDCFMGSGTTGLVALKYSRRFLGIELNPEYIKMAEKRIEPEKKQLKMF